MAKYLTPINLTQNELLNGVIHNVTDLANIIGPVEGQLAYNSTTHHLYSFNGTTWVLADSTDAAKNVFKTITDGFNNAVASGLTDTFTLTAGTGMTVVINPVTKVATFTNTDLGSSQMIFKTISDGTNSAVADSNSDTLVFAQNGGLTVSVNPETDTVIYSHADTSAQSSITEVARTYISGISVDGYGHVTSITTDPEVQYSISAETVAGGANLRLTDTKSVTDDVKFSAGSGIGITRTDASTITIEHSDTSTATNLIPATRTYVSGLTFDTFGHVTGYSTAVSHEQNTDTGTTSSTFVIDSDAAAGITLQNNGGELQIKNLVGDALADLRVQDLYVEGTQTVIHSTEVDIGDAEILLNANITTYQENSDGGIAIKRLASDNTTRKDAKLTYNEVADKWQLTFGSISGTIVTAQIATKVTQSIGDGVNTSFVVPHNLNTRDLTVAIRQNAEDYALVYADIEFTTLDSITVRFALPIDPNQYTVTIVG